MASELIRRGAKIKAYDAQAVDEFKRSIGDEYLKSIEFTTNRYQATEGADALILITEWKEFRTPDWELLNQNLNQPVIFDGRNIYDNKIRDYGFTLYQIGC